jgi:hypothetical protein
MQAKMKPDCYEYHSFAILKTWFEKPVDPKRGKMINANKSPLSVPAGSAMAKSARSSGPFPGLPGNRSPQLPISHYY